jgi:hypothetical protein
MRVGKMLSQVVFRYTGGYVPDGQSKHSTMGDEMRFFALSGLLATTLLGMSATQSSACVPIKTCDYSMTPP